MPYNKWWSTKVAAKLPFGLVVFLLFSSKIPLEFRKSIREAPIKHLEHFLAGILESF